MAIGGSGTSADPYIVHDWEEFAYAVQQTNNYTNLANDIQAPSSNVNLDMQNLSLLDGKGYSIIGLICTSGDCLSTGSLGGSVEKSRTIQNVSFTNIHMDGGSTFLHMWARWQNCNTTYNNLCFSGVFESGTLFNDISHDYGSTFNANKLGINIEAYNSNFALTSVRYGDRINGTFENVNAKIKYMNISPSAQLFGSTSYIRNIKDSLLDIDMPTDGAKLTIGARLNNCCIIGSGSGVIIGYADGVNVVENTIPPETSLANVYSVTTAQMQDAEYLHDTIGFPIGVE